MNSKTAAHRKDIEENIIGAILRMPTCFASSGIKPEWFTFHKHVIDSLNSVAGKGHEIDIFSIIADTGNHNLAPFLHYCSSQTSLALTNLPYQINKLYSYWKAHAMKVALESSLNELVNGVDVDEVIQSLMKKTLATAISDTKQSNFNMKQALGVFVDKLEEKLDNKGKTGLYTGIDKLDKVLGGLHPSDMTVVGARPGVGKTAFGVTVMMNLAKKGTRVGFISTEMPVEQIMLRVTSAETGIAGNDIRDVNLTEQDFTLFSAAVNKLHNLDVRICDKPNMTIADVSLQCQAWAIDGIDFILVDYLTRIKPVKSLGNIVQDVGDVVSGLKTIARQLNVPVMVLAQLNRKAAEKKPLMSDLRDSGIIEQEADQVILLYRPEDDEKEPSSIIVDKNRHGESNLEIRTVYKKDTMQWLNLTDYADNYQEA